MPTPAEEAAEAPTAAANLLAALADPGAPEFLVEVVRAAAGGSRSASSVASEASAPQPPSVGAVFFEVPLAAAKTLCMVLATAKDRGTPAATRFKSFAAKSRLVTPSDVENAIGVGLRPEHVDVISSLCATDVAQTPVRRYAVVVSIALCCGVNVVRGASYDVSEDASEVRASVRDVVVSPAAPSVWAMTPKHTPENPSESEPWLYCLSRGRSRAKEMPPFAYGGALRPAPIMTPRNPLHLREVPESIPRPDYAETADPVSEAESKLQSVCAQYSAAQVKVLRTCCDIARGALDATVRAARPGVTTEELDKICHAYITAHGGYPSPLNYYNFPKSCCTSVNEVICHGIPDARELVEGDILNVDVTAYFNGYHGDLNETVLIGKCDQKSKHLLMTAYKCLQSGIEVVKPGARYRDIGEEVTKTANKRECSVVKSYCGHGIGTLFHCAPNVPHYAKNKAVGTMKEGHVFTIEPMINAGDWRDHTWPDGWTAVTKDGSRSAQYEHTMVVTADGVELLTARTEDSPRVFPWTDEESDPKTWCAWGNAEV